MEARRIYVAGPMRGYEGYNFPAFHAASARLRGLGHDVVNPAEMSEKYGDPEEVEADPAVFNRLVAEELAELRTCDAICLLRGWERSEGTRTELEVALSHGLDIIVDKAS